MAEAKEEVVHSGKGEKHVHVEESASRRGSIQRKLTMKYDMHALKTLQEYEETLEPDLLALYKLTEADDLSAELDLLSVFNAPPDVRVEMLTAQLTKPADDNVKLPEGADIMPLITKILIRMDDLTAECLERERTKAERKSFG